MTVTVRSEAARACRSRYGQKQLVCPSGIARRWPQRTVINVARRPPRPIHFQLERPRAGGGGVGAACRAGPEVPLVVSGDRWTTGSGDGQRDHPLTTETTR